MVAVQTHDLVSGEGEGLLDSFKIVLSIKYIEWLKKIINYY